MGPYTGGGHAHGLDTNEGILTTNDIDKRPYRKHKSDIIKNNQKGGKRLKTYEVRVRFIAGDRLFFESLGDRP
jgi:hypothetical protein